MVSAQFVGQAGVIRQRRESPARRGTRQPPRPSCATGSRRCRHRPCAPRGSSATACAAAPWARCDKRYSVGRSSIEIARHFADAERWTISSRVRISAVAVRAMRGTLGNSSASWPSCRYSGRKSCPHCDTQCASSMANRAMSRFCREAQHARLHQPLRRQVQHLEFATANALGNLALLIVALRVEFSAAAATPNSSRVAT